MTLASDLLPLIDAIRAIPGQLGLRPFTVAIVTRNRTGTYGLSGTESIVSTPITCAGQPPKVRFLNAEEMAQLGLANGSVEVGPITPEYDNGGMSYDDLTARDAASSTLRDYQLTGPGIPDGAYYRLVGSSRDHAMHYKITLEPLAVVP